MALHSRSKTASLLYSFPGMKSLVWQGLVCLVFLACPAGHTLDEITTLEEYRPVLDLDSFSGEETDTVSEGWEVLAGDAWPEQKQPASPETWALEQGAVPGGGAALCVTASEPVSLVSPPLRLNNALQSVSGSITATGAGDGKATLYWMAGNEMLGTVALRTASGPEGRHRFNLSESDRPAGADSFRVTLVAHSENGEAFCWQTVRFIGVYTYAPEVTLMVNRLGYEQIAPKNFTARSNFPARSARFSITNELGDVVYEASLGPREQVRGAGGAVWEDFYYRGDFTDFEEEGNYTLTLTMDDCPALTAPIRIRFNLLWKEAFLPVVAPFQSHRASPDPASDSLRLWEDSGMNSASDAVLLWSLVQSWSLLRGRFPEDPPLLRLEAEALYGAGALADWIRQGNAEQIIQHDEFPLYLNALTCVAHYKKDADTITEAARILMEPLLNETRKGMWFFFAAMDLYDATDEASYLAYAKEIYPGIVLERVESLLEYEYVANTAITVFLREAFSKQADILVTNAANPFGLVRSQEYFGKGFFTWNEDAKNPLLGNTMRLLSTIQTAAQAYRYSAQKEYLVFVYDQLNWLLGNNPFGICLVSGLCGEQEPPVFPVKEPDANTSGALVLHGTGPQKPDLDLPRFTVSCEGAPDENTNGHSLHNNAHYIRALAYLKRIPVVQPR